MVGEPLADPAWVPTALLARRAAQDVKLALVGEGRRRAVRRLPDLPRRAGGAVLRAAAGRAASGRAPRRSKRWPPSDKKVTRLVPAQAIRGRAPSWNGIARHLLWTSNIPPASAGASARRARGGRRAAGGRIGRARRRGRAARPRAADRPRDLARRGAAHQGRPRQHESALELRAPFLDRDVMEFAATLPVDERVRGLTTKVFLKRYALRYLPRDIVYRKKRGLSVPLSRWLRGPLREWAESRLGDPRLERAGVHPEAAREVFREHCERRADHARALWTVIVLDEWLRWAEQADDVIERVAVEHAVEHPAGASGKRAKGLRVAEHERHPADLPNRPHHGPVARQGADDHHVARRALAQHLQVGEDLRVGAILEETALGGGDHRVVFRVQRVDPRTERARVRPVIRDDMEGGIEAVEWGALRLQRAQGARSEGRAGRIDVQHVDQDSSADERLPALAAKEDQRVQAVHGRPAADVEQVRGPAGVRRERRQETVGGRARHALQTKAHRDRADGARQTAIESARIARAQVAGPELEDVGRDAAQVGPSRLQRPAHDDRAAGELSLEEAGHPCRLPQPADGFRRVRLQLGVARIEGERRVGDIDDGQLEPVVGHGVADARQFVRLRNARGHRSSPRVRRAIDQAVSLFPMAR